VEKVAEMLQVDPKELAACFIQEATVTRGIVISSQGSYSS
jgi:hypothetical protein